MLQPDERLLGELASYHPFFKGRLIGVQGQPCDGVYVIARGQVLLCRADDRGEDYALYLLGAGELFGEGALHPESLWMLSARAVTDGAAYVLPAAHLPRLFEYYPQLAAQVLALLSLRLECAHRRLDMTHLRRARDRVLRLLYVMSDCPDRRADGAVWMPLGVTQAELGEMIGLARETVARALAELEAEGAIRREGRSGLWLQLDAVPDRL